MNNLDNLTQLLLDPMQVLWSKVSAMIPNILTAIAMLIIGYFLARFVAFLVRKSLQKLGVDTLAERLKLHESLRGMNITLNVSDLFGMLVFLFVMVAFALSATETLGFEKVSSSIDQLLQYLPRILGAALVLMFGLFAADFVRAGIRNAAENIGLDYAPALARVAYGLMLVVVIMLATDQLQINLMLLNELVGIILVSVGVAVALSLGLGSRDVSRQMVSGVYLRDLFESGADIEVDGQRGKVIEVGTLKTTLDIGNGKQISFANQQLIERTVVIHSEK